MLIAHIWRFGYFSILNNRIRTSLSTRGETKFSKQQQNILGIRRKMIIQYISGDMNLWAISSTNK